VSRLVRGGRLALAGLALFGAGAACSGGGDDVAKGPAVRDADEGIGGVLAIRITSNGHTQGKVAYDRRPPAGGDHNPTPAPCGFYPQQIADEYVVHTLEHGAVWLAFSPTLSPEDRAVLEEETADNEDVIATPYAPLEPGVAVVVTSWGRQLTLDSVRDPRLDRFVQQYRNSKLAPERSIPCPPLDLGDEG
jgi:hypothetical protein